MGLAVARRAMVCFEGVWKGAVGEKLPAA